MSSDGRSRRRELVEEAYNLQVKAGLMARPIPFGCARTVLSTIYRDYLSFHVNPRTGRGAIRRIWFRLCDFRAPYLACFQVSLSSACATEVISVNDL
jgi:hypothetical protein